MNEPGKLAKLGPPMARRYRVHAAVTVFASVEILSPDVQTAETEAIAAPQNLKRTFSTLPFAFRSEVWDEFFGKWIPIDRNPLNP